MPDLHEQVATRRDDVEDRVAAIDHTPGREVTQLDDVPAIGATTSRRVSTSVAARSASSVSREAFTNIVLLRNHLVQQIALGSSG